MYHPGEKIAAQVVGPEEKERIRSVLYPDEVALRGNNAEELVRLALHKKPDRMIHVFYQHILPGHGVDYPRFLCLKSLQGHPEVRRMVGHLGKRGCRLIGRDRFGERHEQVEKDEDDEGGNAERARREKPGELFHSLPYRMRGSTSARVMSASTIPTRTRNEINIRFARTRFTSS